MLLSLATALSVAACQAFTPADEPVSILTGAVSCYAGGETGGTSELVADSTWGTRFGGAPVMWPEGYTARDTGTAIVILDRFGTVKATTGRRYHISNAFAPSLQVQPQGTLNGKPPGNTFAAAVECGY